AYVELLANDHGTTVAGFLRRARRWFRGHGSRVQRALTDYAPGASPAAFAPPVAACISSTAARVRTRRAPMARPSASSRQRCGSGRTSARTTALRNVRSDYLAGSTTTTAPAPMAA